MKRLIYNVGINDADYPVSRHEKVGDKSLQVWMCPFYQSWLNIFKRVYNKNVHKTYRGCSIDEQWYYFTKYKSWMESQKWEGNQLDKDIIVQGNKLYGPETCAFVPQYVNKFLTDSGATRGIYPQGVYFHKASGKFLAQCHDRREKKQVYLGLFETPDAAHDAWLEYKHSLAVGYAEELLLQGYDVRVVTALKERFKPKEKEKESNAKN